MAESGLDPIGEAADAPSLARGPRLGPIGEAAPAASAPSAASVAPRAEPPAAESPAPPVPPPATTAPAEPRLVASARTYAQLAAINEERLVDVFKGMARETVERVMEVERDGRPLNPYRQESLRDGSGRAFLVLFYLTREPLRGRPVRESDLTPVIFEKDKLVDIGRYPLKKLRRTACPSGRASAAGCSRP